MYRNFKMVNITKIRWIPILMIFSQLMLAGFVSYWLMSQFKDEKELLRHELSRTYEESQNQVIDSLVFNRLVEPALNDSLTITMMTVDRNDTHPQHFPGAMHAGALILKKDTNYFTVKNPGSIAGDSSRPAVTFAIGSDKQNILIRSVKLLINHSGDSAKAIDNFPGYLPGRPDTALFKKFFTEKIQTKELGITLIWTPDSIDSKFTAHKSSLHFTSSIPDYLPAVQAGNDFPYLIRRISPQILFALILLLLTGSAFYFTNRSLKRQVLLNSLRNDFVSNITHELKTPVSTVKVAIEALKTFDKVKNPDITREYLDMAGQEMNRLDLLISQVLDQSLIGEQNQVISTQPSDIKTLIDNVLITIQPRISARNATIKFESSEIPDLILIDPLHVQGVVINLIDNSLKYGPATPEIVIRLWQDKGATSIEVSDNGPGIPKEYLGRVFDKFFRVPKGDTHNIKGYGLGLSFAALVMKQHHGTISVKNLLNGGCAFTLRFPKQHHEHKDPVR